jgi:hypothetical protein
MMLILGVSLIVLGACAVAFLGVFLRTWIRDHREERAATPYADAFLGILYREDTGGLRAAYAVTNVPGRAAPPAGDKAPGPAGTPLLPQGDEGGTGPGTAAAGPGAALVPHDDTALWPNRPDPYDPARLVATTPEEMAREIAAERNWGPLDYAPGPSIGEVFQLLEVQA